MSRFDLTYKGSARIYIRHLHSDLRRRYTIPMEKLTTRCCVAGGGPELSGPAGQAKGAWSAATAPAYASVLEDVK